MPRIKLSENQTDVALSSTKTTLEIVKELTDLIPADCVGPIIGAAVKIIEVVQASQPLSSLCFIIDLSYIRERDPIKTIATPFSNV